MGAIRGILVVFASVFLFLVLLTGNVVWTFNLSLDYDNVKPEVNKVLDNVLQDQNLNTAVENNIEVMELYCQTNSEYDFNYDNSGYSFNLPCSVVLQGSDAVVEYITNDFVDEFYYQTYDCGFLDCFDKVGPFFLVSQKAKDYWGAKAYLLLIVSLILVGALFILTEKKSNTFIIAGSLLIVASLIFVKLDLLLSFFSDKSLLSLLSIFFDESYTIFVISLIIGIILLAVGILLKIFKIGFNISNLFSKFSKKEPPENKPAEKIKKIEKKISPKISKPKKKSK